ncbi:MAG: 30S ribosomal protein S4e [Candidatus Aenigmarchaeota archaeon]|nr:30S ribosomal protein S4e [Candidatus Aenigmarchaeota archaeon]
MAYLKRLAMPDFWPLEKKRNVLVVSPLPGPHAKRSCIPLQVVLRDMLHIADSAAEARKILKQGKVMVDRKVRKEVGFPVGLMDVVEIPDMKKTFRVIPVQKGVELAAINAGEAAQKICRIVGKSIVKGGDVQLHMHDGRNVLAGKAEQYKVGDSVMISLPEQKITKHYKMEKGAHVVVVGGKNRGKKGVIRDIRKRKTMLETSTVSIKAAADEIETLLDLVMAGEF